MNMRKIIAVLAAVLMLCSVIPMSAISVAAAPGASVLSMDFENEVAGWSSGCTIGVVDDNGNKVLKWDASGADWANIYKYGSLSPNTDYVITFKAKADAKADMNFKVNNNWAGDTAQATVKVETKWLQFTIAINSGDCSNGALLLFSTNTTAANATTYYLDDISIVEAVTNLPDPVQVFDFEDDKAWSSGCTIGVVDDNGNKVMKWDASGADWANTYKYGSLTANTTYLVKFKAKADRETNMNFKVNNNWGGDTAKFTVNVGTEWQEYSRIMNVGACTSAALLLFSSNTTAANGATYYLDDISFVEYVESEKPEEPSFDGYVTNGNFETGDLTGWKNSYNGVVQSDIVHSGSYAHKSSNTASKYQGMMQQNPIAVKANTDYAVSFWYYYEGDNATGSAASFYLYAQTIDNATNLKSVTTYPKAAGAWYQQSLQFNSGDNTQIALVWSNRMANDGGTYYFDDIVMWEVKDASDDGYIQNGDFETGVKGNFSLSQSTQISQAAAKDGNFGAELIGNGGWGGLIGYTFAVENGATYKLSFDAKVISVGANVAIVDTAWDGEKLKTAWISGDSWKTYELEFTAISGQCYLNMNGGGTGTAEHVYLDNVKVTLVKCASCTSDATYECTDGTCTVCGSAVAGTGHSYAYPCDPVCQICYEITKPDAAHSIVAVEAVAATCTENGNIAYWYCEHCGACWADEALTQVTNHLSVVVPTIEHSYDNIYDAACNVCGGVREVPQLPVEFGGKSISEDVSGLAFKYDLAIEGVAIKNNTYNQADFTNATFNGHKLLEVGVIASNGQSSTKIQGVHMCELEGGVAAFVYRVVNIPADKLDVEITMTPYYVVEIDGVETTVYGEAMVGSYAEIAG